MTEPTPSLENEFTGKSFKECLEIIVFNPKDADWTTRQIKAIDELHATLIKSESDRVLGEALTSWIQAYKQTTGIESDPFIKAMEAELDLWRNK